MTSRRPRALYPDISSIMPKATMAREVMLCIFLAAAFAPVTLHAESCEVLSKLESPSVSIVLAQPIDAATSRPPAPRTSSLACHRFAGSLQPSNPLLTPTSESKSGFQLPTGTGSFSLSAAADGAAPSITTVWPMHFVAATPPVPRMMATEPLAPASSLGIRKSSSTSHIAPNTR